MTKMVPCALSLNAHSPVLLKGSMTQPVTAWLASESVLEETEVAERGKSYFRVDFYSQNSPE